MPVEVEVGGDAAVPAKRKVGPRAAAHVLEPSAHVPEEGAPGEAAASLRRGDVDVRVRVDDEQVEPAVAVVVEPAEAAAHHRGRIQRHAEAESAVSEGQPDLRRDVDENVVPPGSRWRRARGRRSERHASLELTIRYVPLSRTSLSVLRNGAGSGSTSVAAPRFVVDDVVAFPRGRARTYGGVLVRAAAQAQLDRGRRRSCGDGDRPPAARMLCHRDASQTPLAAVAARSSSSRSRSACDSMRRSTRMSRAIV